MAQFIEPKHLLATPKDPTQSVVRAAAEENSLARSHSLASPGIPSVRTTNMRTIICYAELACGSGSSHRNQSGALGSRAIIRLRISPGVLTGPELR